MKTKKLKEILDEIQELLKPKQIINTFNIKQCDLLDSDIRAVITPKIDDFSISQFNTYVYEMPKE